MSGKYLGVGCEFVSLLLWANKFGLSSQFF